MFNIVEELKNLKFMKKGIILSNVIPYLFLLRYISL